MFYLYLFSKITTYIALISLVISFFSDLLIFKFLCFLVFVNLILDYSVIKCSFLQMAGIAKVKKTYKDDMPSPENHKSEVEYILPFHDEWVIVNGCFTKEYSHSWDIPTQRYAYDFIILDEKGSSFKGEFDKCQNYYCYDKEIFSPADGVVIEVVNNARDSLIFSKGRFLSRARHIAGNYIVIQHGGGEYSTLAHLKKDSITVKAGDTVTRGQCIAKCGNTGNSTEPHLHFQLQTGQSFYSSAGLPVQFHNINVALNDSNKIFDSRPHMDREQITDGYITRGFTVSNKE